MLPVEAFSMTGINAGVLLTAFDIETGAARREDILGETAGPVRFSAKPVFTDLGSGIKNCPENAMEFKLLKGWDVKLSGRLVTADARASRRLIGFAEQSGGRLTPRGSIDAARDFGALWLVFDYGDVTAQRPGSYAILMKNALSTGGLRVRLEQGKRARWQFEFTAFCSVESGDEAFEVYVEAGK